MFRSSHGGPGATSGQALGPPSTRPSSLYGWKAVARHARNTVDELERGREAYAKRAWLEAYELLSAAERRDALDAPDARLNSIAALMLGRDDEAAAWLERAHQ